MFETHCNKVTEGGRFDSADKMIDCMHSIWPAIVNEVFPTESRQLSQSNNNKINTNNSAPNSQLLVKVE